MQLYRVRQQLISAPIKDVSAAVAAQLDGLGLEVPQGDVAITVGSRGIANIPAITRACGEWLRPRGANPFIVPSMGSHNGATAEGQQQMVESLGMCEAEMGMPIRSSMECVQVGKVASGDVWMDRHCYEADGVLVVNRVKLHTCFSGPVQSGLVKMMVVGMGKIRSAETFHSAPTLQMKDMLLEMGQLLIDSGKIWGGLAILEDGFDQTAELHSLAPNEILDKEPGLLTRCREYFPRLPVDELNVLIVDEIGKTYSGTGMDPNVIGFRGVRFCEDISRPDVKIIAALKLADASQGNAIGVGLADFITRRLRDAIDERKTFINVYTTGDMARAKIPATLDDDQELVDAIRRRFGDERWMFIPNTLHLEELYVTADLCDELEAHPSCTVDREPIDLSFKNGCHQLAFG
ncbi:lactate racemase domain-containing protein [Pirellulales bacterium]|nr:lactate racemase domain-containing protein [Pirellulales bacterium]